MAVRRFKPEQPDRHMLGRPENMTIARFGHLNTLVEDINRELSAISESLSDEIESLEDTVSNLDIPNIASGVTIADATDESDAVTKLNALLGALRSVGIIS